MLSRMLKIYIKIKKKRPWITTADLDHLFLAYPMEALQLSKATQVDFLAVNLVLDIV